MQKELLKEMLLQNRMTCSYALNKVSEENKTYRLNPTTASVGFIYRHIGETMHLFGSFFGTPTSISNTTIGQSDTGQGLDIETSRLLIEKGYALFENLVNTSNDEDWLKPVDTPFFGTVSRMRLFSHVLFHNAHHTGQISLIVSKGKQF